MASEGAAPPAMKYAVGDVVIHRWRKTAKHEYIGYPADILICDPEKNRYKVHYHGFPAKKDLWVLAEELIPHTDDNLKSIKCYDAKGRHIPGTGVLLEEAAPVEEEEIRQPKPKKSKAKKKQPEEEEEDNDAEAAEEQEKEKEEQKPAKGKKAGAAKKASKAKKSAKEGEEDVEEEQEEAEKKPKKRGRKKASEDGEGKPAKRQKKEKKGPTETRVNMPEILQRYLVSDWERVKKHDKVVPLPREPSVATLMDQFVKSKNRPPIAQQSVTELMEGLRGLFDRALPDFLLYNFERPQYEDEVKQTNKKPSDVYGLEHTLRFAMKLPELVRQTRLSEENALTLTKRMQEFLRFLCRAEPLNDYQAMPSAYKNRVLDMLKEEKEKEEKEKEKEEEEGAKEEEHSKEEGEKEK